MFGKKFPLIFWELTVMSESYDLVNDDLENGDDLGNVDDLVNNDALVNDW